MTSPLPTATAVARRHLARILAILLAVSAISLLAATPARAAVQTTIDGITYSVDPGTAGAEATATNYFGPDGSDVVIPDTVTIGGVEYTVTAIGDFVFYANQLTSVTLPDTLTTLGAYSFAGNSFTSIDLPDSLTTIGDDAFFGSQLTSVEIPDSVTSIGEYAFYHNRLSSVILPRNLTTIAAETFAWNHLTAVTLPDSLTTIENRAFAQNSLTSITLPDTLTTIEEGAFLTNNLASLTIPAAVTSIGPFAFNNNSGLTQVRFAGPAPASITGTEGSHPSLGTGAGLTVAFHARYQGQHPRAAFTTPTWLGYAAIPAYTVSFDTGEGSVADPVTVWPDETLELPSDPTRQGHTFTGWYTTPSAETAFDPALPLSTDLTVYAGWQATSVPSTPTVPATPTPAWTSVELGLTLAEILAAELDLDAGSLAGLGALTQIGDED